MLGQVLGSVLARLVERSRARLRNCARPPPGHPGACWDLAFRTQSRTGVRSKVERDADCSGATFLPERLCIKTNPIPIGFQAMDAGPVASWWKLAWDATELASDAGNV